MAKTQTLKAETRNRTGSGVLKQMRREGYIPSVVYGKGSENINIKVNTKALTDMLARSASESILVDLEVDGGQSTDRFPPIHSAQRAQRCFGSRRLPGGDRGNED